MFVCRRGIRRKNLIQVHSADVLSCGEERHFWLSWQGGHIAIGRGLRLGQHSLVAYIDLNPITVTAIAFTSINSEAAWRMPLGQGNVTTVLLILK